MLIVDHKIYTLTAAERWYVLHADYRFANEYQHDYDIDDSVSDEELAAEQPYPDYDLDELDDQDDQDDEDPRWYYANLRPL